MSKDLSPSELDKGRAKALADNNRRHVKEAAEAASSTTPQGLVPHIAAWNKAAVEATKRAFAWVGPVTKPIRYAAPKVGHAIAKISSWHWNSIAYRKGPDGKKHFSPKRLAFGLTGDLMLLAASPFLTMGAYYHATLHTYNDIFVPNAGVFVNQQFVQPSQPGHIVAPRDEIFTVLAQRADANGKVDSIRFDVDSNMYFAYKGDALRPDLAAAKMVPISPFGAMCNVEATGLYTRLPRFARVNAVKWLDMRPEIVHVISCEQLQSVPPQYAQGSAPPTPQHFKQVTAGSLKPGDVKPGASAATPSPVTPATRGPTPSAAAAPTLK